MDFKNRVWRNDIKDFLYEEANNVNKETIIKFPIKGRTNTLEISTNRPDLIFGATFILMPQKNIEEYNGLIAINPFNDEEIPIYFSDIKEPKMGVPAHDDDDYVFALANNISMKQVIIPVNTSVNENAPRDDKEWTLREVVVLVVKHWSEDKYLYISYNNYDWKCFITGGIETGESKETAAIRELEEESGYYNIKSIKELPFSMINVFYAAHKGVNRYITVYGFYIELNSGNQHEMSEYEIKEHTINWENKENLLKILENGFTDCIWLLKQSQSDIKAYTGNGKYINSDFLNDIEDRAEAIEKITSKLIKK